MENQAGNPPGPTYPFFSWVEAGKHKFLNLKLKNRIIESNIGPLSRFRHQKHVLGSGESWGLLVPAASVDHLCPGSERAEGYPTPQESLPREKSGKKLVPSVSFLKVGW